MNRRRFLTAFAALSASLAARADNPFALPENSGALPEQSAKPDIVKPYLGSALMPTTSPACSCL